MLYNRVDDLLTIFQLLADRAAHPKVGLIFCNINPFMVILQMLDISSLIKERFNLAALRASKYEA